jgi:RNA polymerase sigma-70 factor (ECF subfamily)
LKESPVVADELSASPDSPEEMIRSMLPRVYRYFAYRIGEGMAAEDLAAETLERAWVGRQRYRPDRGPWQDWVLGIARHLAADHFRRRDPEVQTSAPGPIVNDRPTEDDTERRLEFARVSLLLSRVPARERELVALKYGAGLTNRAIARMTGLSESNVGTILHRLVSRLRRAWEETT